MVGCQISSRTKFNRNRTNSGTIAILRTMFNLGIFTFDVRSSTFRNREMISRALIAIPTSPSPSNVFIIL